MTTGFVYHPQFQQHDTGPGHPESPARLQAILDALERAPVNERLARHEPGMAAEKWLLEVHTAAHIERVREGCAEIFGMLDPDTSVCAESWEAALRAVGALLEAADRIVAGEWRNAFCAVRPPGHHAESDRAMGFCLFNNVAVAARYLQKQHDIKRVLIVDWDVHHGNGTQEIFDDDPTVFYFSLHQYPYYPGTGAASETGKNAGKGYTLNAPMPAGSSDEDYFAAVEKMLLPAAKEFKPEFILVSAGFDGHADDPLAAIRLSDAAYARLGKTIMELAAELCGGRLLVTLEGGYNLDVLGRCTVQLLEIMATP